VEESPLPLFQQQLALQHQLEELLLKREAVVVEVQQEAQVLLEVKQVATNLLQMKLTNENHHRY
jgi:hypothetical protein